MHQRMCICCTRRAAGIVIWDVVQKANRSKSSINVRAKKSCAVINSLSVSPITLSCLIIMLVLSTVWQRGRSATFPGLVLFYSSAFSTLRVSTMKCELWAKCEYLTARCARDITHALMTRNFWGKDPSCVIRNFLSYVWSHSCVCTRSEWILSVCLLGNRVHSNICRWPAGTQTYCLQVS